jgi:23S rRNA (cytosine1962-C5)-methyltransferase
MLPAMPTADPLPRLRVQPGRDARLRNGYPWAFSNELTIDAEAKAVPPGGLVRLEAGSRVLGIAGLNRHTLIAARLLTRDPDEAIDAEWFRRRIARARSLRDRLFDRPYYRLVHAEADGLPGLIADRYGDVVVAQLNTATMDRLRAPLLDALAAELAPRAVVFRNDGGGGREIEGLPAEVAVAAGDLDGPITVEENGARFPADPLGGQKTGWFFDQRDNRAFAARLARGLDVLDCYTHTGGFAVQAALAGATQVAAVDRSAGALEIAAKGAAMNGVAERVATVKADAFAEMQRLAEAGRRFGLVIVDPPAFAKTRKDQKAGIRGYTRMTRLAARLVAPGGFLVACSCSHHVDAPAFADAVRRGLIEARRAGRVLRQSGAGPDHPVHPLLPESAYLKAVFLQLD